MVSQLKEISGDSGYNYSVIMGEITMAEYRLTIEEVKSLFEYVESQLAENGCNHSLKYTKQWLVMNIPRDQHEAVLNEIEEMGGYCDCEVLLNCYEDYIEVIYN